LAHLTHSPLIGQESDDSSREDRGCILSPWLTAEETADAMLSMMFINLSGQGPEIASLWHVDFGL
jgi:hypothetical protein